MEKRSSSRIGIKIHIVHCVGPVWILPYGGLRIPHTSTHYILLLFFFSIPASLLFLLLFIPCLVLYHCFVHFLCRRSLALAFSHCQVSFVCTRFDCYVIQYIHIFFLPPNLRQSSKYMVRRSRYVLVFFFSLGRNEWIIIIWRKKYIVRMNGIKRMEIEQQYVVQPNLYRRAANAHLTMCWMCYWNGDSYTYYRNKKNQTWRMVKEEKRKKWK